jgi:hypothetical protein
MLCGLRDGLGRTLRFRLTFWNTGAILALTLLTLVMSDPHPPENRPGRAPAELAARPARRLIEELP